ncbi:MAG TPA: 5-(carboxyamino)imidazole ribonucleotide mutase [Spirochaetota bacterium]|nr:5-(carboxyamino)imidazole ribonucleotide mutase [Spirochaetota bacterium]HPF05789.1 5-(carboxyamino)imidazole ribonucleotide mutase [Spirochaetota bacterium]HPJ43788.1 5-(carboxyamino)imidazole ribonucleotide mutase [Spirochaetota bacterium]HPR39262.1 5-(carboxyamino)imidazole ribonucleotide mutase [Spirochaetota bacterium]HRX47297.1 5-(carboxyamino)imidazole ribonucleotide mutase [Spirochaetota bacterium]
MPAVGIILGSDSDLPKVKECFEIFDEFNVEYEVLVSSAHRSPEMTVAWVKSSREKGMKAIIAIAGGAAHLPGVVASHTTLPVIGIPIETNIAGGLDSILSILQMPAGIPVGTMAAGKSGGANAALYALSIISVSDNEIAEKLTSYRKKIEQKIEDKNKTIKEAGLMNYIKKLEGK